MAELVTLDEYKQYKDIKSTEGDGKHQTLITRVSKLVETYCSRKFVDYSSNSTPKIEWFDAKTNAVQLTEFPVIEVISVKTSVDGGLTQVTLDEAISDQSGYFVDLEDGMIYTQKSAYKFLDSYDIPYRSLEVTYTAGYTVDTIPEDLKLAVLDLVEYYAKNEKNLSKTLLGGNVDFPSPYLANSFPPHIRRILDLYRYSP